MKYFCLQVVIYVFILELVAFAKPRPHAQYPEAADGVRERREVNRGKRHRQVGGGARSRRSVQEIGEDLAIERFQSLPNITGKKYMLELYQKLSNASADTPVTQANTIKSLNYEILAGNDPCKFKFSMTGVNKNEFVLQTKLRLYLEPYIVTQPTYIVHINSENPIQGTEHTVREVLSEWSKGSTDTGRYIEFDVADIFRLAIGKESSITFAVKVNQSPTNEEQSCGKEINFHTGNQDEAKIPMLVVYSFERSEYLNLTEAEEQIKKQLEKAKAEGSPLTRRRRNAPTTCGRHELYINSSMIPPFLIGGFSTFTVILPHRFNAGICGGQCDGHPVHKNAKHHSVLINVLLRQNEPLTNKELTQCCAPLRYKPMHILGVGDDNKVPVFHTIDSMKVVECGCTDVVR